VSDTTGDDSSTKAGNKRIQNNNRLIKIIVAAEQL
jgi:hypothetical protein